jgi:hypothetical protein
LYSPEASFLPFKPKVFQDCTFAPVLHCIFVACTDEDKASSDEEATIIALLAKQALALTEYGVTRGQDVVVIGDISERWARSRFKSCRWGKVKQHLTTGMLKGRVFTACSH